MDEGTANDTGSGKPDDREAAPAAALYRLHARAVFAVCLANTPTYHDAEDVMQAVFVKAVAKTAELRQPDRARSWLLQIARRACVDFYRRRKPVEPLDQEPSDVPARDADFQPLHEAIQRLPKTYREAIILYYLDGRDCATVAAALGTSEQAVRQRLMRARVMLHDLLDEENQ
jgi:RNA polymerase sigma-70 factor, ECF subfamily